MMPKDEYEGPGLWWSINLFFHFMREHVRGRMMHLTGHTQGVSAGGMRHYWNLVHWYIACYLRNLLK